LKPHPPSPSPIERERCFIKIINIVSSTSSLLALINKVERFNFIQKYNLEELVLKHVLMCCLLPMGEEVRR